MKTLDHQMEIAATRKGGFGGSDAKMFYKIGLKGIQSLSNTDKKRIAVAKGLIEYKAIMPTAAMKKGHDFEQWFAENVASTNAKREVRLEKTIVDNFRTFAHADFYEEIHSRVSELKCVSSPGNAQYEYAHQLQWYYMMGAEIVSLFVADSSDEFNEYMLIDIDEDEKMIEIMLHGINLLNDAWDTLDLSTGDEWDEDDLMTSEKNEIITLANYVSEIKRLEQEAEERKARMLEFMQHNGIKAINSEYYSISLVPEGVTSSFDKKKLFKDHPELNEADYIKTSARKSFVKITVK